MKKLKEDRFDKLEYLYVKGSYTLIRKYEQGPFLKKILNGNVFDKLYRYVSAGKLKTKDNPFNVKNWKVGDDILLGLTSTLPFEDPKNLKKDLGVNFSYCMVFKGAKGYSVKYDAKDFTGYKGIEDYKWQKEVLTAGLFHVDNIEQKGKITYVELSTVKQDKETFIEILRKTRKDLESGEFNKQYPTSLGVEYANYDVLEKELKDADLTIFNTNNLSQKDIGAIKKLPKVTTYEDLYYFIKEYGLYEDLQPLCIKELPKEFTKEVWNNTLINMRLALPEDIFPQNKDEAYDKWNCVRPQKKWPKETGEYISFQNNLEGIWFIANKYFALKSIKEKLEKDSLNESKYVDKDIEPLGKKLSQHSDDGFIDFCTAKVLDDLNKGDKKKLNFYEFWDWAAEVGSKDIVELIYHDFKNGKLDKDSSVYEFYKTYEKIKDLSLKDPKKFVKLYGWAFEDKIKDKNLKEGKMKKHLKESEFFRKGQAFEGKRGKLYISRQLSPDEYLVRYSDFLLPSLSFTDWTFSEDELEEAIRKVQYGEQLVWDHFQSSKLKESESEIYPRDAYNKRQREIEKKKPGEGRFYDRFDFTTPRVDESKRTTNKKRIQESRGKALFQGGFPANLIYVGDPCYCLNDAIYQDAIDQADPEGKFDSIASGAHVEGAFVDTAQGDGEYEGSDGRSYSVDAGIIGIVNITNASATEGEDFQSFSKLGRVIKLPKYAATQYEISRDRAGVITVNIKQGRFNETIEIPTGFAEEYTCNECGEPISEWEYQRYGGCCESCYRESMYGSDDDDEF